MKVNIENSVNWLGNKLPEDILIAKENYKQDRDQLIHRSFKEAEAEKYSRLAKEYQILRDVKNEEMMLKNRIVLAPTDWTLWQQYAEFC